MNKGLLLLLAAQFQMAMAADTVFKTDIVDFGKPAAANKTIKFRRSTAVTQPGFRFNNSSSKMEYSDDGTTYNEFNVASAQRVLLNSAISTSASAGALTISLTQSDGATNCSTGSARCQIAFRTTTGTHTGFTLRTVTAALSAVIPSTATLGHGTAANQYVFVYAVDNAGTISLAVSSTPFAENALQTVTALNTASDLGGALYGSAGASLPIVFIARIKYNTGVNGTWVAPSSISFGPSNDYPADQYSNTFANYNPSSAAFQFHATPSNSVTLGPGTYDISGEFQFNTNANVVARVSVGIYGANGANNATTPALANTLTGVTIVSGFQGTENNTLNTRNEYDINGGTFGRVNDRTGPLRVTLTTAQTLFGVTGSSGTGAGYQVNGYVVANRVLGTIN